MASIRPDPDAPRADGRTSENKRTSNTKSPGSGRVNQEDIDAMSALRRLGFTYAAIGQRTGFSERTARRYAGRVKAVMHVPSGNEEPTFSARTLRDELLNRFVRELFEDESLRQLTLTWTQVGYESWDPIYGGPPSTRFMREAERLLRDALQQTGEIMLRLIENDRPTQQRFVRDAVGDLRIDYERWLYVKQMLGSGENETGDDWRPIRERRAAETNEVNDLWRRRRDFGL